MKKMTTARIAFALLLAAATTFLSTGHAQSTAYWTNSAAGEWNTPANWNVDLLGVNLVPAEGTNADIGSQAAATVTYDFPMTATSFRALNVAAGSVLSINTNGFNMNAGGAGAPLVTIAGTLNVNPNGVLTATNGDQMSIGTGGALNVSGSALFMSATASALSIGGAGTIVNINNGGAATIANAGTTTVTGGGVLTNNGSLTFSNTGPITLANLASPVSAITLNANGVFTMTNTPGATGMNVGATANGLGAIITINGGIMTLDKLLTVAGTSSRVFINGGVLNCLGGSRINETGNDNSQRIAVNGGNANLGNFSVYRSTSAGGLVVSNGTVNATGIQIGVGNAASFGSIFGGVITNTGVFTVSDTTNAATSSDRRSQFLVRGGTVVSTSAGGIVLANLSHTNSSVAINNTVIGGVLDINAGMVIAEKITLIRDTTISNAYARLQLSGSGIIYLGSGGLVANVGVSRTAFNILPSGGTFAAKADWSSSAPMAMSGTVSFQAADAAGAPHDITFSGQLSGSGAALAKTGAGTLTLNTNDTYTGNTLVAGGTLALGAGGSISNTPQIILTNGAVYDVSAVGGAQLVGNQVLSGQGSVAGSLTANSGNAIRPGGNNIVGALTFSSAFSETGGVINNFDLSTNNAPGSNDFINVVGDLNLGGTNTIQVNNLNGPLTANNTYTLIHYGGSFATGGVTNLALSGAAGTLVEDRTAKTISLVISSGIRGATNVTWVGSAANSNWDLLASSNWLNGVSRDYFVTGDNARFDDTGATNPTVTVVGSVLPNSMVVDSASNYTFTGSGTIDGNAGLIKTNSGMLTLSTLNNNYPGATIIGGGIVEAAKLAIGGSPSSLGIAGTDPANLQFFGTTLRYLGANASTDRGATLNGSGATLDIASSAATLTASGSLVGSGGLTKSGPGALILSGANAYNDVTTVSNGILQINGSTTAALATNAVNLAGGTLFLNASGQPTYSNTLNVVANSGLNVAGNNTIFTGPWSGAGTVNVNINSGGFLTFNADITTNFVGALALGNSAGTLRFNAGGNGSGTQQSSGSPMIIYDLGTNSAIFVNRNGGGANFGTYYLGGLAGGSNTFLRGSANSGSTSTYRIGDRNASTTFAGTIQNGFANLSTPQASAAVSILKVGTNTLTLTGTNTYSGSTVISNGVLALSGFGSIANTATISVLTNTFLDVSASTDGTLTLNSSQTLQGSGTILGSVIVSTGSTLNVGDDLNISEMMVITNSLTLQNGCTLNLDLDHYQLYAALTNDTIQGLASVTYGGTLALNVLSVETNSVFKLFSAGSYSGAFESISPALPPLSPAVWGWDTSRLIVDGTLRITSLRPSISGISLSGTDLTISGLNGIPGSDFYLLTSTNVALPVSQWISIGTNNFGVGGNFQFTFGGVIDPTATQHFYLLQIP